MDVVFRPVTKANWAQCGKLRVHPHQEAFVAPNLLSMAEVHFYPELIPQAIYAGETLVGMLLYGYDDAEDSYWVVRLMIDREHQGKGYGRAAMRHLLAILRAIPGCRRIRISYAPQNEWARGLYLSLGFVETGEVLEGETVAEIIVAEKAHE
ncbi:MAG TPA: GNAT family N-acetyltransferase [Anaerolineaceae bacterium]